MIQEELLKRSLPGVLAGNAGNPAAWGCRRAEILALLSREMYGFSPPASGNTRYAVQTVDDSAYAGKAVRMDIRVCFDTPRGEFSFPAIVVTPKSKAPVPLIIYISFRPAFGDGMTPMEEIVDGGFAVASFCYTDAAPDDGDFARGLPSMYPGARLKPDGWGKLSVWAWAASRLMDCAQMFEGIDKSLIAVAGHSRLGKTALWCAAQDERFAIGISNDSGCAGAALSRGTVGETVERIGTVFPFWFCGNYHKYVANESEMAFDQHFLLAAIAPRAVYVASAEEDLWADPASEFLCCAAASQGFEALGLTGLVTEDRYPRLNEKLHDGRIAYHVRPGTHYLSRYDWNCFMEYINKL